MVPLGPACPPSSLRPAVVAPRPGPTKAVVAPREHTAARVGLLPGGGMGHAGGGMGHAGGMGGGTGGGMGGGMGRFLSNPVLSYIDLRWVGGREEARGDVSLGCFFFATTTVEVGLLAPLASLFTVCILLASTLKLGLYSS